MSRVGRRFTRFDKQKAVRLELPATRLAPLARPLRRLMTGKRGERTKGVQWRCLMEEERRRENSNSQGKRIVISSGTGSYKGAAICTEARVTNFTNALAAVFPRFEGVRELRNVRIVGSA